MIWYMLYYILRNFIVDKDLVDNDLRINVYSTSNIIVAIFICKRYTYGTINLFECTFFY